MRHEPLRTQLLRTAGGDRDLVDDILQDTWLQAVWTWRERGVPDRPAAWLATVARHLMLNRLRSRRRVGQESTEALNMLPDTSLQADVSGLVEQGERTAAIRAAHGNDDALLRIPLLDAIGVGTGTSTLTKRLAMTALLPLLLVLAVAPIAFVVGRLPRRQLALLRVVGGLLFLSIATISVPSAARAGYAHIAQLIGIATAVWGFWMLRTPETATRR